MLDLIIHPLDNCPASIHYLLFIQINKPVLPIYCPSLLLSAFEPVVSMATPICI